MANNALLNSCGRQVSAARMYLYGLDSTCVPSVSVVQHYTLFWWGGADQPLRYVRVYDSGRTYPCVALGVVNPS